MRYEEPIHNGGFDNNYWIDDGEKKPQEPDFESNNQKGGKNIQYLGEVTFNHILRENNGTADMQANLAVNRHMGESRIDNEIAQKSIP